MKEIIFSKYHGLGNDFIIIDNRSNSIDLSGQEVQLLCHRKFGIGSDGIILLEKDRYTDFYMRYYNSDGSEVGMCGNGSRCIGLFAKHLGFNDNMIFRAQDGLHRLEITHFRGCSAIVKVEIIDVGNIEQVTENEYFMNTGVNHIVQIVTNLEDVDVVTQGRKIRYDDKYAQIGGTNANFIEILDTNSIKIRTYERGVENETMACGTGATAAAIATAIYTKTNESPIKVYTVAGEIKIYFTHGDNYASNIYMEAEAKFVFNGKVKL